MPQTKTDMTLEESKFAYRAIFLSNNMPSGDFPGEFGALYCTRHEAYEASLRYNLHADRRIIPIALTAEEYERLVRGL